MIAKTEAEARRQAAIMERRRAFIERWAQPKLKRAYIEMSDVTAELYEVGGSDRITAFKDEVAAPMAKALDEVFKRVNDTLLAMAKKAGKAFGGKVETKAEDEDLGVVWEEIQRSFTEEAFKQSKIIAETFVADIVDEIRVQAAENLSPADIAKAIRDRSKQMAPWKSDMIARTEAGAAISEGQASYIESLWDEVEDGPLYKKWHAVGGSRTRDVHRKMDNAIVPKESTFKVGRDDMRYPHDRRASVGNLVNCRCSYAFIPEELVPERERNSEATQNEATAPQSTTIRGVEVGADKKPEEVSMHNLARWSPETDDAVKNGLRKSSPIDRFLEDNATEDGDPIGAHYMDGDKPYINIPSKQKRDKGGTARHEFGHHIDADISSRDGRGDRFFSDSKEVREAGELDAKGILRAIPDENYSYGRRQLELSADYDSKEKLLKYAESRFSGVPADLYKYTTDRDLFNDLAKIDDAVELNRIIAGMDPLHWGKNTDDVVKGPGIIRTLRNLARTNGFDFNQNTSLPRFSDTIENITYAEQGSGHGRHYYEPDKNGKFGRGLNEAFANYVAELGGPKPKEARRLMDAIMPNTARVFDKGLKSL